MSEITLKKVSAFEDLWKVYHLVNEVYNLSGIARKASSGLMIHHPDQDVVPQSHIFLAEAEGKPIGTITYTIDNQFGLMVDDDFKQEIALYRMLYSKISSVWRFAILPEYQSNLKVMKKLIGAAFWHMKAYHIPICFLTISPQHARIYTSLLNMEEVSRGKDSNELIKPEHADIVLLKAYANKIPEKWCPQVSANEFVA